MILDVNSPEWPELYKTTNAFEAQLLSSEIEQHGIECVFINKVDSSYPIFGKAVLYVKAEDLSAAKKIIEDFHGKNETEIR